MSTMSWTTPSPPTGTLPTDVTVKIPVPAGTVNAPGTIVGAATTVTAAGRDAAWYVGAVVAFEVGAVVGAVVFGAVVAGVVVFAVVGAVVAFVVEIDVPVVVAEVGAFVVATVVAAEVVVLNGSGTVVPGKTVGAPETGRIMPPTRAARKREMTSRRTPRFFERCMYILGGIAS